MYQTPSNYSLSTQHRHILLCSPRLFRFDLVRQLKFKFSVNRPIGLHLELSVWTLSTVPHKGTFI